MPNPSPSSSSPPLLPSILHTSHHLLSAHTRHFLALSLLFLLPPSSLLIASPSLFPFSHPHHPSPPHSLLRSPHSPPYIPIIATLISLLTFLACASISVAFSINNAFFGRPVHLLPALRSLPLSLSYLSLTFLPVALIIILSLSPLLIPSLPVAFTPLILTVFFMYYQFNYSLSGVVSTIELTYGFAPFRRSSSLIKGMRCVTVFVNLLFGIGIGVMVWGFCLRRAGVSGEWSEVVPVVARTVVGLGVTVVLMLYWIVTNVVVYLYCKAVHGELEGEIAEEFAEVYLYLPGDEEKVPHVVSVVRR